MKIKIIQIITNLFLNPGAPRCAPELNLPNLNPDVQVRVRRLAAPNLNVHAGLEKIARTRTKPDRNQFTIEPTQANGRAGKIIRPNLSYIYSV